MSAPDMTSVLVGPSPDQPACDRGPEQRETLYRRRSRAGHVRGNG
jgi:hypothetical protein